MTFLFDREKAMAALEGFEAGWGGAIEERMARDFAAWKAGAGRPPPEDAARSEEHTSELQSLMRISYAVFCLKKKTTEKRSIKTRTHHNNTPKDMKNMNR